MACHHSILNDFKGSVSEEGLPEGYVARHLQLSEDDGKEINRAMMADGTSIHGVKVNQIYGCVMGAETSQELRNKIEPWVGRSFFKVRHPSTGSDMMYVPITQTRVRFEREDATRILVPYVPKGAKVQLMEHEHIQEYDETQEEWMREQHEMRSQIMMMCHDNEGHPKEGQTRVNVRSVAYWPEIKAGVKQHYESCSQCLPERKIREQVGHGILSLRRLMSIQIDHYVLCKEWADACGVPVILTITDEATRITSYETAMSQTAIETARIIHDRWIPYYSTPFNIVSDPHPGFASEVMTHLRKIMGIKGHEKSAPRAKGKTAMVESRHHLLGQALADGFIKGDIRSRSDLQTYCAQAKKRHDQDSSKEVSPFECLTGQMPYSSRNLSLVARRQEERIQVMHACHEFIPGVLDEEGFVKWIQRTREEGEGCHFPERRRAKVDAHLDEPTHLETQTKQIKAQAIFTQAEEITQRDVLDRDDTARDNVLSRQRKNSRAPHTLTFKIQVDDQVAHDGKLYLVKEVFGPEGYPITARLEQKESKKMKMAKVVELRPPATPRPSTFLPRERPKFDDLIFFYLEESLEVGIMVSEPRERPRRRRRGRPHI